MIEILQTGGLTTVQDRGRFGLRKFGVGASGPLDNLAAAVGNTMLGNGDDAAFLEILLFPFKVRFTHRTRIAITGADARARISAAALPPWWSVTVAPGDELLMQGPLQGGAGYLCVQGGIDVPAVLGSRSTDLKAGFGGHEGRPLRKGDQLASPELPQQRSFQDRRFGVVPPSVGLDPVGEAGVTTVRVMPSAQWHDFALDTQERFAATAWHISPQSNRIGLRLEGDALQPNERRELLSHGIVPGVIQVPPGGQPIVMQCDAQTSGGYPKIATVIEPDRWRLAQAPIGGRVRFLPVDEQQARGAADALDRYLHGIALGLELRGLTERT